MPRTRRSFGIDGVARFLGRMTRKPSHSRVWKERAEEVSQARRKRAPRGIARRLDQVHAAESSTTTAGKDNTWCSGRSRRDHRLRGGIRCRQGGTGATAASAGSRGGRGSVHEWKTILDPQSMTPRKRGSEAVRGLRRLWSHPKGRFGNRDRTIIRGGPLCRERSASPRPASLGHPSQRRENISPPWEEIRAALAPWAPSKSC